MAKKLFIGGILAALILVLFISHKVHQKKNNEPVIGILQLASFPALDAARVGFENKIHELYGKNVTLIVQNAEGSLNQAQAIAASFRANQEMDLIYAMGTTSVQTLKQEISQKPIVFAAVTNPQALHLRPEDTNVTGASDMLDVDEQVVLMKKLIPKAKKIAILYTTSEDNSVFLVQKMKSALKANQLNFVEIGVTNESDVGAAVTKAASSADVILIPTDVLLSATFPIVKQISEKAHVPLVVSWTGEKLKPLMQFGVNYEQVGEKAALMAYDILKNKKTPAQLPISLPTPRVLINSEQLDYFKLTVPKELKNFVTIYN